MGHVSERKGREVLFDERRRLLDYVLETHKARGGKVQLPIGMNTAEPWLLDAVDVQALLAGLHHQPKSCLDLLQYCRKATRTLSFKVSRGLSDADAGSPDSEVEHEAPSLHLPQLNTGLSESEIKDLAYLVFASNCNQGTDEELLSTVRSQLDIDEARAGEVSRLLEVVASTFAKMKDATGALPVSDMWTANLELPVCLLGVVLPKDFSRFRSFVVWRDTLSHVLLSTLAASVRDGWSQQQGSNSPSAQQLMARLKAALRRCDVRDADDFDDEEYRIASRAVGEHAYAIVKCTAAGWAFPWGLRVRLCEMLLRGVFDTLDETSYIDDADNYLKLLQTRLWPLLKISPSMHNAGFAWIHFRQFVVTQHPSLVSKTKALLKRLAQLARRHSRSSSGGRDKPSSNGNAAVESAEDAALTHEVGTAVIDWIAERLADYHLRISAVGGSEGLPNLVDVMAFAALSKGASEQEVGDMLAAAIRSSVSKELQRRIAAAGVQDDETEACETMCSVIRQLAREEVATWAGGFVGQLPEATSLALAVLHEAAGARILPWLSTIHTLDDSTCKVLRAAMELEPVLLSPVAAAADACQHVATRQILASARSWDIPAQLQPALAAWVQKQLSGFTTWVDRQLQQESWTPLGNTQPHSASARELRRIVMESLEALFDLQLPLPASILSMHMEGIDSMLHQYLQGVLKLLGSWTDMIPAVPGLTRYKREVAVKQEQAEMDMLGMPTELPPPGCESKKGVPFAESVKRIEQESCYERITRLTPEVLIVMMASLGYLLDTLQPIATAVTEKWQEECRRSSTGSSSRPTGEYNCSSSSEGGNTFLGSHTAAAASDRNPFMSPSPDPCGGSGGGTGRYSSTDAAATDSWGGSWGLQQPQQRSAAVATAANGGGRGCGSSGSRGAWAMRQQAADLFRETLDCAGQSLRHGIATVTKWLAVRVVWWQQRAGWCELLYRHRVTSCRIDWLLGGLADVLGGPVSSLPREPRLEVASALLKEAALGLERALLDGGPCKWFIPADVAHLIDDLDSLERLFFAEGDGLQMQEVSSTTAGLRALLKVLLKPTGTLIEDHRTARRRSLANFSPSIADVANGHAAAATHSSGSGSPYVGSTGNSSKHLQQQPGPLPVGKLAAAAAGGTTGSGGVYVPAAAIYSPQQTGGSGAYSPRGGGGHSPRHAANAAPAAAAGQSVMVLAAGGVDVGSQEHVLLKVLCHRADHAASKYLKETTKVPKPRDETVKETFSRLTRLGKK